MTPVELWAVLVAAGASLLVLGPSLWFAGQGLRLLFGSAIKDPYKRR